MYVLGLDYETTGLDHNQDRVLEVGAVVWDMKTRTPVYFHSCYVLGTDYPLPNEEAQAITGIEPEWVRRFHSTEAFALRKLEMMAQQCDYMVAHNAEFEMNFTLNWLNRQTAGHELSLPMRLMEIPWIDTKVHLPFPPKISVRDLVSLCAHHGFHNPHPHRAFWDAWSMIKILDQYAGNIDEIVANSQSPRVKVWSKGITFNTKDLPKSLGYYWSGETKRWWTVVKESEKNEAIEKAKQKGFDVETEVLPVCATLKQLEEIRSKQS